MDTNFRKAMRSGDIEFTSAEELIGRRIRAGACPLCARHIESECGCIGAYIYNDINGKFRLNRNTKSTLPCGIVTSIVGQERSLNALMFSKYRTASREEEVVEFKDIVDFDIVILNGVDVGEAEKQALNNLLVSFSEASDLWENND